MNTLRQEVTKFLTYFQIPFEIRDNTKRLIQKLKNSPKTNWDSIAKFSLSGYFIEAFADKLIRDEIKKECAKPVEILTSFHVGQLIFFVLDKYPMFEKYMKITHIDENWIMLSNGRQVDIKTNRLRNISGVRKADGQIWATKAEYWADKKRWDRWRMLRDFINEIPVQEVNLSNKQLDQFEQMLGIN